MNLSNRRYLLSIVMISMTLLCLVSCGDSNEQVESKIEKPEKVVSVDFELVTAMDLRESFTLPAGLEAWEDLLISAEIAGPVRVFNYQEGERVEAGAILLEINPETLQSSLNRDEDNYAVIKRKLNRYRKLASEGLVSAQVLDELQNSLTSADMALQVTRLQLAKCFPKAPTSGIVDLHYIDRGEFVDVGKPLLRLVQIDKLYVVADVPEKDISFLKVGQPVEITPAIINQAGAQSVTGAIEHIALSADPATRTYRTKIVIENSAEQLRPGMIVRARFVRQQLPKVISAPLYAVLDRDGQKVVFVEEDGVARKLEVKIGSSVEQRIVITQGLNPGQKLIVKGQQLLFDGVLISSGEN